MTLNYIWIGFFVFGFLFAIIRWGGWVLRDFLIDFGIQLGDKDFAVFESMVQSTFDMAETSISLTLYLAGVMALWTGLMKIAEEAGAIQKLSKMITPFFAELFPSIPKGHRVYGSMMLNFSANMLGLDNAATPMGLRAMSDLQVLNPNKETASDAQIMFLVLNTSGLTLLPISVMAIRAEQGAANPADIFIPTLLATFCSTMVGIIWTCTRQGNNVFRWSLLKYLLGASGVLGLLMASFTYLSAKSLEAGMGVAGNFILVFVIVLFLILGYRKKLNVYETFITGAKEGLSVSLKIAPYLVAMLVAIGVFRASGALDMLTGVFKYLIAFTGASTAFVDVLPVAFLKPLSGSGARGMMIEIMTYFKDSGGADSFQGTLASIMQGSTETTFYILTVYFGAVNIKNTRYAITAGLIADLAGVIAAIIIAYLIFSYRL